MISNLSEAMIFELCNLPSRFFSFAFFKFKVKAIFLYDFVGFLFPLLKFSCCLILITELFLKALNLFAMNISQSFFDYNENSFFLSLNKLTFFMFR